MRNKDGATRFELTVFSGEKAYFLRGTPKGFVCGPIVPHQDDHITVGNDGEEIVQVHRKINGREDWRITPESLQAEADSFLTNHTLEIDTSSVNAPGAYIVSLDRANILFSVFQSLISIPLEFALRLFATFKVVRRTRNCVQAEIVIEPRRIRHLWEKAQLPLAVCAPLLRKVVPILAPRLIKRVGRHLLVAPNKVQNLKSDVVLLVSNDRFGLVWMGNGRLLYLPATSLAQAYERIERNQPFGKLSQLGLFDEGLARISIKSLIMEN